MMIEELKRLYASDGLDPDQQAIAKAEAAHAFADPIIENLPNRMRQAAEGKKRSCLGSPQFVRGVNPVSSLEAGHRLVLKWLGEQGIMYVFKVSETQEADGEPWWHLIVHGWANKKSKRQDAAEG